MKFFRFAVLCGACSSALFARPLGAAEAFYTGGGNGSFTDPARWLDGYVPQAGDAAVLLPSASGQLTIPDGSPFTLSAILLNTNNASYTIAFYGETNTLVAPAVIAVSNNTLAFRTGALAGSDGLAFFGRSGNLELATSNLFAGPVSVTGGRILPRYDTSLGAVPEAFDPAALTLNGGMLGNYDIALSVHANRGLTAGPDGAYLHGRAATDGRALGIESPITGPGPVTIIHQTGEVEFRNPASDYAGDTIFGEVTPVGYYTGLGSASLFLGADEVVPDTSRLVFPHGHDGVLNLNGHEETVGGIVATNGAFAVANASQEAPGALHSPIPSAVMNASVGAGATLDLTGDGTARFNDITHSASAPSAGTLSLSGGRLAVSDAARLGAVTLALKGGGLALEARQPGLAEYRSAISASSVNTNATAFTFGGVWTVPRMANASAIGFPQYTQYLYEGEWFVPAAATYSFGKAFDDGACLIIDGQTLLFNNTSGAVAVTKDVALSAGWHTFRLYVSQGTGGVGPSASRGFVSAVLYDPANGDITNGLGLAENAYPFADPGDGSALRTLAAPAAAASRARLEIFSDASFDRSAAPGAALVWAADVVSATDATLTVTGGSEPFTLGSTNRPAVFEADVADANGVRFQDKVWVKTLPANLSYGANADLAVGVPGLLGIGAQTLSGYSLRLPTADALGEPADAPVTVNTGRALTFDSTAELDSHLIDDPDRAFTASNAVILAGGTLAFDGAGTVTLDSPVSGSGALVKAGSGTAVLAAPATFTGSVSVPAGTLSVLDQAALGDTANPVALTGGALDLAALTSFSHPLAVAANSAVVFPGAPFTLTGVLSGTLRKTGPAALSLAGSAANESFDLYVAEGSVTLANTPGPAVRNILGVDTNASAVLGGSGQIGGGVTLTGGTLDLAGYTTALTTFNSAHPASSVAGSAALTVGVGGANGAFVGSLGSGVTFAKTGAGTQVLAGTPGASGPAAVDVAQGTLALGLAPSYVRFTVLKTRTAGKNPRVGELVLTRGGRPLPYRNNATTTGSSSTGGNTTSQATDGSSATFWLAGSANGQYFSVSLGEQTVVDGYRLYSGTNATDVASANDPVSWRVEFSADNASWLTVDTVTDAALYSGQPGVKIYERAIDPAAWPSAPFGAAAPVTVAAGANLRAAARGFGLASLAGAGAFDFLRGASATLGDVSGFTGAFSGAGSLTVAGDTPLDIPAAAVPAPITGRIWSTSPAYYPPDFPTVLAASAPASAVVGASGANGSFAGRILDGAAPAGLTKVGAGKTTLTDVGSAYTGDTAIEGGTLSVNAGAYTFRYIRFNPTLTQSGNVINSGFCLAISEFQLLRSGQVVAWPSGTTALTPFPNHSSGGAAQAINGAVTDRWLSSVIPNPLTINTQAGVTFDTYRFYDSGVNAADTPARCPVSWTLEGSDDGTTWTAIDAQSNVAVPAYHSAPGRLVGTFALRSSPRAWLPAEYRAATPVTNQVLTAVTAEKFCFQVLGARTETTTADNSGSGYALTELTLLRNGEVVPWPDGTTAWAPTPGWGSSIGNPMNLVNNNEVATDLNRYYSSTLLNHVVINAHTNLTFDAYRWVTTYNVAGRDPTHWRLFVMPSNGVSEAFYCVDEQVSSPASIPTARGAVVGPFPIIQPAGLTAVDAIPDSSRVRLAQGATLALESGAFETVGPLSGTGTVALANGAVLGINAFDDAVFAGVFSGSGALRLQGAATQAFSGATLGGVSNVTLSGTATLAGTAAVPGNLSLAFEGGSYAASLAVSGSLTVSGAVKLALPAGAHLPHFATLFTFASADAATRAALIAGAATVQVPEGFVASVRVSNSAATLAVAAPGLVFMVR
jgi:autotransporter-associated beta strand protein